MKRHLHISLTPEDGIALRRIACQSLDVEPKTAARLVQQALAERFRDGWRLTPLGLHYLSQLPKAPLHQGKRAAAIDKMLDRVIPLARALAIPKPEDPSGETDTPCAVLPSAAACFRRRRLKTRWSGLDSSRPTRSARRRARRI